MESFIFSPAAEPRESSWLEEELLFLTLFLNSESDGSSAAIAAPQQPNFFGYETGIKLRGSQAAAVESSVL